MKNELNGLARLHLSLSALLFGCALVCLGAKQWVAMATLLMAGLAFYGLLHLERASRRQQVKAAAIARSPSPEIVTEGGITLSEAKHGKVERTEPEEPIEEDGDAPTALTVDERLQKALTEDTMPDLIDSLDLLVSEGANLSLPDEEENALALAATYHNNRSLVSWLVERGARVKECPNLLETLINEDADKVVFQMILEAGGNPNESIDGETLVGLAIKQEREDLAIALMDGGAVPGTDSGGEDWATLAATADGSGALMDRILRAGREHGFNYQLAEALSTTINNNNMEAALRLLSVGADPFEVTSVLDESAVQVATENGDLEALSAFAIILSGSQRYRLLGWVESIDSDNAQAIGGLIQQLEKWEATLGDTPRLDIAELAGRLGAAETIEEAIELLGQGVNPLLKLRDGKTAFDKQIEKERLAIAGVIISSMDRDTIERVMETVDKKKVGVVKGWLGLCPWRASRA